jgi:hypothetical protein
MNLAVAIRFKKKAKAVIREPRALCNAHKSLIEHRIIEPIRGASRESLT